MTRVQLKAGIANQHLIEAFWSAVNSSTGNLANVAPLVKKILLTDAWRRREVRQLDEIVEFDSFTDFITTKPLRGCGWPLDKVEALIKDDPETLAMWREATTGKPGRPTKQTNNNVMLSKQGNSRAYTLDRLRREYPELFHRVVAGELSTNAAAIEAGFRKKTPVLDQIIKLVAKLTPEERRTLKSRL